MKIRPVGAMPMNGQFKVFFRRGEILEEAPEGFSKPFLGIHQHISKGGGVSVPHTSLGVLAFYANASSNPVGRPGGPWNPRIVHSTKILGPL